MSHADPSKKLILIVEDELAIRDMLRMALHNAGFDTIEAGDVHSAYEMVKQSQPSLILLDWMLPGTSGPELIRRLKRDRTSSDLPIIMLTAKSGEDEKIVGLESGADDYITKPFSPRELIARIKALLRRTLSGGASEVLSVGCLSLDYEAHRVLIGDEEIRLGPTEYKLLHCLMQSKGRVLSRGQILDRVWGDASVIEDRTVDVHVRRLRTALTTDSGVSCADLIDTVRGVGYKIDEPAI